MWTFYLLLLLGQGDQGRLSVLETLVVLESQKVLGARYHRHLVILGVQGGPGFLETLVHTGSNTC